MSDGKDDADPKAQKGGFKNQLHGFGKFIWNSETHEFIGRTGKSWASIIVYFLIFYTCLALFFYLNLKMFFLVAVDDKVPTRTEYDSIIKYYPGENISSCVNVRLICVWDFMYFSAQIIVYYIIFYGCLAAFFAINISLFFTTIDDKAPRLQGFDTLLKGHPGMGFRPSPDNTLIKINITDPSTYTDEINGLNTFLAPYFNQTDSNIYQDCSDGNPPAHGKVCRFDVSMLGNCTADKNYGYKDGQPCVLLKLNKIYGWTPQNLTDPSKLSDYYNATGDLHPIYNNNIPITCQGEVGADIDNIGEVSIFPPNGLPFNFYPYLNQDGYMAPIAMVQFTKPMHGALLMVWCKAWANNIYHDRTDQAGSVHFELMVDI
jgi:sodium/potassium-transporting ATPase subunit beta